MVRDLETSDEQVPWRVRRGWWWALILVLTLYGMLFGGLGWFMFLDHVPFEILASSVFAQRTLPTKLNEVTTLQAFAPGEPIFIYRKYCLGRHVRIATVRRWLYLQDDTRQLLVYAFPTEALPPEALTTGCHELPLAHPTPDVPEGHYFLAAQLRIEANVMREELHDAPLVALEIKGTSVFQHYTDDQERFKRVEVTIRELHARVGLLLSETQALRGELAKAHTSNANQGR